MTDALVATLPEQFIRIDNLDQPVYRIFPLWHLEETLRLRNLVLVSPSLWEDPFEVIGRSISVRWFNGDRHEQAFIGQSLPPVYAQCWSKTSESDTLLRAYSRVMKDPQFRRNACPRDEGVKVRSTPRKLIEALIAGTQSRPKVSCFIGSVLYLEQGMLLQNITNAVDQYGLNVFEMPSNHAKLLLLKRDIFAHEAEVRIMAICHSPVSSDSLLRIRIDPNMVFDEITFDPRLETLDKKERESLITGLGYKGPFGSSSIYNDTIWLEVLLEKPPGEKTKALSDQ